jgi:hypothetical protein
VRVAHLPARLAGFSTLQSFIERGFDAFRRLQDAGTFIKRIEHRETMFMNRLFANEEAPLVAGAATAATANAP